MHSTINTTRRDEEWWNERYEFSSPLYRYDMSLSNCPQSFPVGRVCCPTTLSLIIPSMPSCSVFPGVCLLYDIRIPACGSYAANDDIRKIARPASASLTCQINGSASLHSLPDRPASITASQTCIHETRNCQRHLVTACQAHVLTTDITAHSFI